MKNIKIGQSNIGEQQPCYVIAEAGVNHNGKLDLALQLVEKAKEVGADCVKFQTFKAESIITKTAPKAQYQLEVTSPKESQFEMLKGLELNPDDYLKIIEHCKKFDIQFLSTPYNFSDAIFLNDLGVDAFKIASGQIIETSFLEKVAKLGKPMIVSSGMATLAEVYEGVEAIRTTGNTQVVLLQCTTNYPSALEEANIKAMNTMGKALDVLIGYSDHVPTNYACYAAVAREACVIEKHFTLDNTFSGPDHKASLDIEGFKELVKGVRSIETALGNPMKKPSKKELINAQGMRRSLVAIKKIPKGEVITENDIGFKRPATGLKPNLLSSVISKVTKVDIFPDTILTENMIEW